MTVIRTEAEFWATVDKSGECWLWTGSISAQGYGTCTGPHGLKSAHRLGYFYQHGELPGGAFVCHHCDVRNCVRGDHLYAGDYTTNGRDMRLRNRCRPPRGERAPSRVAFRERVVEYGGTEPVAALWRSAREAFGMTELQFAEALGCGAALVYRVESAKGFPHTNTWDRLERLTDRTLASLLSRDRPLGTLLHVPSTYDTHPHAATTAG